MKSVLAAVFRHALTLLFISLLWVLFRNGTKNSVKILLKMFGFDYRVFLGGGAVSAGFDRMLILRVLNLKTLAVFFSPEFLRLFHGGSLCLRKSKNLILRKEFYFQKYFLWRAIFL